LDQRLSQIAPQYVLGTGAPARTLLKLAGAAALLIAAALLARRANASERRGALVAGALAAAGFLLSLALIVVGADELITRNAIVVLIPMIVLIAGGLGARRAGVLGWVGAATLCTIGLVAAVSVAVNWDFQRPYWAGVARAIGPGRPTGAGRAILLQNYPGLLPLGLYMPGLRFMKSQGALVDELDVVAFTGGPPNSWFCWWGSACNLSPSPLDTSLHVPGFYRDGPVRRVNQFFILRLRSARTVRLTPRNVSRSLTTTTLLRDSLLTQPSA
jgi:hypothetical protein